MGHFSCDIGILPLSNWDIQSQIWDIALMSILGILAHRNRDIGIPVTDLGYWDVGPIELGYRDIGLLKLGNLVYWDPLLDTPYLLMGLL